MTRVRTKEEGSSGDTIAWTQHQDTMAMSSVNGQFTGSVNGQFTQANLEALAFDTHIRIRNLSLPHVVNPANKKEDICAHNNFHKWK